jgi:hypothetical protein
VNSTSRLDKAMTPEQFTQVVEAILNGKYSWACLLILRFGGYNPLHYIPYRTYNRLMKENSPSRKTKKSDPCEEVCYGDSLSLKNCLSHLEDLGHLEPVKDHSKVRGGAGNLSFGSWIFSARLFG